MSSIVFEKNIKSVVKKIPAHNTLILTDEHVWQHYANAWKGRTVVVLKANEIHKDLQSFSKIINACIEHKIDRQGTIIGFGGGMITDLAGFVAAVYLRGIACVHIPTSLLAMVDAAIGGKNGINWGNFKNQVGTIVQPKEIIINTNWLATLPNEEWCNAMAEVIKYGAILNATLLQQLQQWDLQSLQKTKSIAALIEQCATMKMKMVQKDEKEIGPRKLLNFGHTIGHAIEANHHLAHGRSVAIGMVAAAELSEQYLGFRKTYALIQLLTQYQLPVSGSFDTDRLMNYFMQDKKRKQQNIDFILLPKLGKAIIQPIALKSLKLDIKVIKCLHEG